MTTAEPLQLTFAGTGHEKFTVPLKPPDGTMRTEIAFEIVPTDGFPCKAETIGKICRLNPGRIETLTLVEVPAGKEIPRGMAEMLRTAPLGVVGDVWTLRDRAIDEPATNLDGLLQRAREAKGGPAEDVHGTAESGRGDL